ncbi:MAG: UbiX family flavin prenyltransferase [Planctomycetia bacterium]|nr:UbiX family flavin prenyltransferase [Planctomycetia bacterium]
MNPNLVLAITGASGAVYAVRLLDVLVAAGCDVQLSISPAGQAVLKQELGLAVDLDEFRVDALLPDRNRLAEESRFATLRELMGVEAWMTRSATASQAADQKAGRMPAPQEPGRVRYHHYMNLFSPLASGSALTGGMVVCPCSGGTLSAIAHGTSGNLIHRAADVHLKERRKLVLVPRETPLSIVQLDNMRRCAEAGAVVLPAMPGYYHGVRSVRDLVDFVVARICDQLGVPHALVRRWGE